MELIVVGGLLFALVWFFKNNTKKGAEAVRAWFYLFLMSEGRDENTANGMVSDISDLDPIIARRAKFAVIKTYGGKPFAMVAEAYRNGMTPHLPIGLVGKIDRLYGIKASKIS